MFSFFSILLKHGAKVDSKDSQDYTPLFYASKRGSLPNLLTLLEYSPNLDHRASNGTTAMNIAKSCDTVMLLSKLGVKMSFRHCVNEENNRVDNRTKFVALPIMVQWCAIEKHQDPFYVVNWQFSKHPDRR